jgi:hypothetical protein
LYNSDNDQDRAFFCIMVSLRHEGVVIMKKSLFLGFVLALLLIFTLAGAVLAQGEDPEEPTDTTTAVVDGTIVDVDPEAGTITLADGTVISVGGTYEHPIVDLLAIYFGGDSAADLAAWDEALTALQLTEGTVVGVSCDDSTPPICSAELADGTTVEVTEEQATELQAALDSLNVSLDVTSDGETSTLAGVGDDIAAYHDSGLGFGELVKLYAIVAECEENAEETCDLTVEFLVGEVQGGMGMGELFALYGKPSLLGVGHVRQALRDQGLWTPGGGGDLGGEDDGDGTEGICNARSHGGNAHATGQGEIVCP